jgi:hypothetical protein
MLEVYSHHEKLDEARATYKNLKASSLDSPIDDIKILHYAGLLIANDLIDGKGWNMKNALQLNTYLIVIYLNLIF